MTNRDISRQELKDQLEVLKDLLPKGVDPKCSKLFDEFMREHEFGLALHVICDYLLEPTTQSATAAIIQQIQILHAAMKIEDDCVADLQKKAAP
jgi:hypothetical protein